MTEQPVPLVGFQEKHIDIAKGGNVERAALVIDRREGFVPVVIAVGYSPLVVAGAATPHTVQIQLAAGIDATAVSDPGAPIYTLHDEPDTTYFSVLSTGYSGIPLPMLGGGAMPFSFRVSSAAVPEARQFRVAWGYRALISVDTPLGGS